MRDKLVKCHGLVRATVTLEALPLPIALRPYLPEDQVQDKVCRGLASGVRFGRMLTGARHGNPAA